MSDTPRDTAGVIVPPPIAFFGVIAASLALHWAWPLALALPRPLGIGLGVVMILAGVGLAAIAARRFKSAGTKVEPWHPSTTVVTDGPFRWTRNPMYLGMLLVILGLAPLADTLWPLLFMPPFWALLRYGVIGREERYLETKFGEPYRSYKASVRRWL